MAAENKGCRPAHEDVLILRWRMGLRKSRPDQVSPDPPQLPEWSNRRETFRFRDFELDVAAYGLRRQGRPVKLGRQQMDLLILLVESRGQLVSRSDIVERLWGKDVFERDRPFSWHHNPTS